MTTAQIILLIGLSGVAVVVALLLQRRRPEPPTAPSYRAPGQVDRDDFASPNSDQLVVVFTSSSCAGCASVWDQVAGFASESIAVQNVEVSIDSSLHKRYKIDGVPTTLVVGHDGVVSDSYFGPIPDGELERAMSSHRHQNE